MSNERAYGECVSESVMRMQGGGACRDWGARTPEFPITPELGRWAVSPAAP